MWPQLKSKIRYDKIRKKDEELGSAGAEFNNLGEGT